MIGTLSRLQRTVYVERERKRKSGEQASELATRLAAGDAMVLFAEGSTADGNLLLPFKSTLFGAASSGDPQGAADNVLIQPVAHRLHAASMACRWGGSIVRLPPGSATGSGTASAEHTPRRGDRRRGAFWRADRVHAQSSRKAVTRQMEGMRPRR